jgi:nucleotide-binding universal stress UspA family protein
VSWASASRDRHRFPRFLPVARLDESRTWVDIDSIIVFGRAHREMLRAAEARPADLIVRGAQGRGGVALALFGSTTQEVVKGATCPVLTVRGLPLP